MNVKEKEAQEAKQEVFSIEISKISANPNQPRKSFSDEAILKLADSIRQYGIIQPLVIRKSGEEYELISGERRLRAAKELGYTHVPCVINKADEQKSAEMAIIENLIREDLNIFEEAEAIQTLIDLYSLTQEEIASRLSTSQSYIANKLRLLRLPRSCKDLIVSAKLTERHARALLKIQDEELREKALEMIISDSLNVSQTEAMIDGLIAKKEPKQPQKKTYKSISCFYNAIERAIDTASNSGIKIKSKKIECDGNIEITLVVPCNCEASDNLSPKAAE